MYHKDKELLNNYSNFSKMINDNLYEYKLIFVLPYHENKILNKKNIFIGGVYDTEILTLKFDTFERDYKKYIKPSIINSAQLYENEFYFNSKNLDFNKVWKESLEENKPFYVLKYVVIKNDIPMYSIKGLDYMINKYPEYYYESL